jgi:hypothetical protein
MCPPEVECIFNLELTVAGRSKLVCFSTGVNRLARSTLPSTADLSASYPPAVACHDAMRNEVTIVTRFRVVAAEAGGVAATGSETTHAPGG